MAKSISQLSKQIKGNKSGLGIERVKYNFSPKKAGSTWLDIYKSHVGDVKIGDDSKKAWNSLIMWAMGHDCDIDLKKSIGLIGKTGSGKTITMFVLDQFIAIDQIKYKRGDDLVNLRYKLESAIVMAGDYTREGYDAVYRYSNYANLCIDDLGAENTNRKHFGDAANVVQEVIEIRHSKGLLTHFTSNLNEKMIQEIYGDRVYSRIIGNTNIIRMNDADYRTFNK